MKDDAPGPACAPSQDRTGDTPHAPANRFISVIVPHYNDLANLDRCLAALQAQTMDPSRIEIVVADNTSPQGEAAVAAVVAGRARLVTVAERGAGPNRNGGVAASRGEILAFIDSDCVAEPDWLAEGVRALADYDFVGGKVSVLVDDPQRMSPAEAYEAVFAFDFKDYITRKGFTGSGNLFVSRRVFDAVGGFRPAVSEDVDWSHRATALGFRLGYAPAAEVGHPARRSWDELLGKWRRVNREMFLLAHDRPRGRSKWLARTWAMPLSALAHTPRVLTSPALPNARARLAALKTLYRLRLWRFVDGNRLLLGGGR